MIKVVAMSIAMIFSLIPMYAIGGGEGGSGKHFSHHSDRHFPHRFDKEFEWSRGKSRFYGGKICDEKDDDTVTSVPEIDASSTALALALLGGMILIYRERRRI